ncbi:MAG: hypothetical protein RBT47_07740 [Anaerolineae bacterium]|jgi:hypothetical protein|nr:hypothetical protein [Anaerolineae bacterium]
MKEASISRADLPWLAGAVFFGGLAAPILLMFSLRETPAASAALLLNFESIATTAITSTPTCPARFRLMAPTHILTFTKPWTTPTPIRRTSTTNIDNSPSHVTIEHKFYSPKRRDCNDLRM